MDAKLANVTVENHSVLQVGAIDDTVSGQLSYKDWENGLDLYKFHEDLRQKRFTHFITLQAAILTITGIAFRFLSADNLVPFLTIIGFAGLYFAHWSIQLHIHAKDWVSHMKTYMAWLEVKLARNEVTSQNDIAGPNNFTIQNLMFYPDHKYHENNSTLSETVHDFKEVTDATIPKNLRRAGKFELGILKIFALIWLGVALWGSIQSVQILTPKIYDLCGWVMVAIELFTLIDLARVWPLAAIYFVLSIFSIVLLLIPIYSIFGKADS